MKEQNEAAARVRDGFLRAVREYDMLTCASVAVALSGGADSVTLLHLIKEEAAKRNIALSAIHINHMIRGEEADRDEDFCRKLCEKLEIPLFVRQIDVPALAKASGKGIEEAARSARYAAFDEILPENKIERIATAHNSDDNAETVLFALARGSAAKGLCGIPPIRDNKKYIRPLIFCEKSDILALCKCEGWDFVTDSTNLDDAYTRNHIRHTVIPALKKVNPRLNYAIARTSSLLREDDETLYSLARELDNKSYEEKCASPDAILSRYLLCEYRKALSDNNAALPFERMKEFLAFYRSAERSSRLSLPGGLDLRKEKDGISFEESRAEKKEEKKFSLSEELKDGENLVFGGRWKIVVRHADDKKSSEEAQSGAIKTEKGANVYKSAIYALVPSATIKGGRLFVRTRRDGDTLIYGAHTHKLKKLLSQRGYSITERSFLPMIADAKGILFVPGFPVRQTGKGEGEDEGEGKGGYTIIRIEKTSESEVNI